MAVIWYPGTLIVVVVIFGGVKGGNGEGYGMVVKLGPWVWCGGLRGGFLVALHWCLLLLVQYYTKCTYSL